MRGIRCRLEPRGQNRKEHAPACPVISEIAASGPLKRTGRSRSLPKRKNDYGFFVGLGNPPGLVVVAGVLVPEG